jgi:hypothetical protein
MHFKIQNKLTAFVLVTLLPSIADSWTLRTAECGFSGDMTEFGSRALVHGTLDASTPFTPSSSHAIDRTMLSITAF